MSRSRRHNPFCGITTCTSEKDDKRQAHQAYRAHVRQAIQRMLRTGEETRPLPAWREHSDRWSWGKDERIRFDPMRHPKLMRK